MSHDKNFTEQVHELLKGVTEVVPSKSLAVLLQKSAASGKPLRVKMGVDPTTPDIHLGHVVVMRKLAQFQKCGHKVILIVGDYTATVGDPSGRSDSRPRLSHEEVLKNAETYLKQFGKFVDLDKTEVHFNGKWFKELTFDKVTKLLSSVTVAQMLEREDFAKRYESHSPISIHEFMYPLMQGYDSVMVDADIEIGGTDQKFNILCGRDLQVAEGKEPQIGVLMPILLGTDGKTKMSKTKGNSIGITEAPDVLFHKVFTIPDLLVDSWLTLLTDLPEEAICGLVDGGSVHIGNLIEAKRMLATFVVTQCYDSDIAMEAEKQERLVQSGKSVPSDTQVKEIDPGTHKLVDLVVTVGAAPSKNEARKLIANGGVRVNGAQFFNPNEEFFFREDRKGEHLLQTGKRTFWKLTVKVCDYLLGNP